MRRILLPSVACLRYHILPHYHIKGMKFGKYLLNIKYFTLQLLSKTFISVRKTERDIITKVHLSSCTVQVIVVRF